MLNQTSRRMLVGIVALALLFNVTHAAAPVQAQDGTHKERRRFQEDSGPERKEKLSEKRKTREWVPARKAHKPTLRLF